MTREEAIKILRREIECLSHTKCEDCILEAGCNPIKTTPYDSEYIEAYEIAIKALEQEPKTGHWIDEVTFIGAKICKCSECNFIIPKPRIKNNFCPNCGARMVEPQKSEDKE